jgi:hypothetical protein
MQDRSALRSIVTFDFARKVQGPEELLPTLLELLQPAFERFERAGFVPGSLQALADNGLVRAVRVLDRELVLVAARQEAGSYEWAVWIEPQTRFWRRLFAGAPLPFEDSTAARALLREIHLGLAETPGVTALSWHRKETLAGACLSSRANLPFQGAVAE